MRWLLLLPLVVLALFFVDLDVASFFCHHKIALFKLITHLGNATPYLLAGLGAYLYYRKSKPLWANKGLYLFLSVLLSGVLTTLLKILIGRPRPKMFFEHHLWQPQWLEFKASFWSMPSGHTTTAFAAGVALGYIFPRYRLLFWIMAALVGLSRIALCKHYPSDVIVAAFIGSMVAWYLHKRMGVE